MNLYKSEEVYPLIKEAIKGKRRAQNKLYEIAFPYTMSIALRYSRDELTSLEIVNEAFAKAFAYLEKYDPTYSFAYWLRKIVINTAIDHYHLKREQFEKNISVDDDYFIEPEVSADILDRFNAEDLLKHIQNLPPAYRIVFSLFAIEGFSHREISSQLGISEGTSKSNYFKAKQKLKSALIESEDAIKKQANL